MSHFADLLHQHRPFLPLHSTFGPLAPPDALADPQPLDFSLKRPRTPVSEDQSRPPDLIRPFVPPSEQSPVPEAPDGPSSGQMSSPLRSPLMQNSPSEQKMHNALPSAFLFNSNPFLLSTITSALSGQLSGFPVYSKEPSAQSTQLGLNGQVVSPGDAETRVNLESLEAYSHFRKQMLTQVNASKSRRVNVARGSNGSSENSDSDTKKKVDGTKDDAYWERRRKNNEAAKRSRDARRLKEDEIAIRAAFLEQENLKLRVEVASLKSETSKLRCLLYNN